MTPGDVVTVDGMAGEYVVNVTLVGGREVSVSPLGERTFAVLRGASWRIVPVKACHPTGDRMCAVHREPFPCGGCAFLGVA